MEPVLYLRHHLLLKNIPRHQHPELDAHEIQPSEKHRGHQDLSRESSVLKNLGKTFK